MDCSIYRCTLPYGEKNSPERAAYVAESNRLIQEFWDDQAKEYGYEKNPKRGKLESIAWSHGHASGYLEVANWISELQELLTY
jgi:hypothetical protein